MKYKFPTIACNVLHDLAPTCFRRLFMLLSPYCSPCSIFMLLSFTDTTFSLTLRAQNLLLLEIFFFLTLTWLLPFNISSQLSATFMESPFLIPPEKAYTTPLCSPLYHPFPSSTAFKTAKSAHLLLCVLFFFFNLLQCNSLQGRNSVLFAQIIQDYKTSWSLVVVQNILMEYLCIAYSDVQTECSEEILLLFLLSQ